MPRKKNPAKPSTVRAPRRTKPISPRRKKLPAEEIDEQLRW